MRRSRATLATIEAAAMVALVASPRTIRSCTGAPAPSARRPSTRRSSARSPTARSARSRQARLAGRSPIRSIWLAGMETSETASAWARTAFASRSRLAGARRFESFTSSRRSLPAPEASRSRSKRTPAAMIGPAQHPPAPTSSTPAIRRTPRARSWARRAESLTECAYRQPHPRSAPRPS